jgi:hypothetical protein
MMVFKNNLDINKWKKFRQIKINKNYFAFVILLFLLVEDVRKLKLTKWIDWIISHRK